MIKFISLISLLLVSPLFLCGVDKKIIALTFDDGPRPYVLLGSDRYNNRFVNEGLLNLLDDTEVKATFFFVGWRLENKPSTVCKKLGNTTDCIEAAKETSRRGHEIENHTYGHGSFREMKGKYGEQWILNDIDRASVAIESISGISPKYVRPPNWSIWQDLRTQIESRGYRVMVKPVGGIKEPLITQDVDSEDYFCFGKDLRRCPSPSLPDSVSRKIEKREKLGIYRHILVFHELPTTTEALSELIPDLKARGYDFVLLKDFMQKVEEEKR